MLIVQKFGGTSVANLERMELVANHVKREYDAGNQVIVVVSAMAGETDRLISLARKAALNTEADPRELDVVAASGEQVSSALLSIILKRMGIQAKSYLGFQVRIITDYFHTNARVIDVETGLIKRDLEKGIVPVVAGFQGVTRSNDITTLGRGGSDITAVILASYLGADVCEIYTDVEGVFTADPNIVSKARKVKQISYEEMIELASLGAKVLHIRSVEIAALHNVTLHVRSTFSDKEGTFVVSEEKLKHLKPRSGLR